MILKNKRKKKKKEKDEEDDEIMKYIYFIFLICRKAQCFLFFRFFFFSWKVYWPDCGWEYEATVRVNCDLSCDICWAAVAANCGLFISMTNCICKLLCNLKWDLNIKLLLTDSDTRLPSFQYQESLIGNCQIGSYNYIF